MTDLICVGSIAGSYGVNGEIRIKSFCADPQAIATYKPLFSEDGSNEFQLDITGPIKHGFAGRMVGIDTKEQADGLKGISLFATRQQLPDLSDNEYYYSDLIGMIVLDTGGVQLGTVKSIMNNNSDDLLEILLPKTSQTALIPFTKTAVPTVDLNARCIVIDPPQGLLPTV